MRYYLALLLFFLAAFHPLNSEPFIKGMTLSKKDVTPFRSPTARQLDYETPNKIKWNLQISGVSTIHWDFWNEIAKAEERGSFGYHAAKQKVRIFQDIIKMIFEEILEFEIPRDFHFLRVPLDPLVDEYGSAQEFLTAFPDVHDDIPQQRNQILSMNYTLFGNSNNWSQCTVCYFTKNHSWFDVSYENKLLFLFNELGIPSHEIGPLFAIGKAIELVDTGVLYQFTDTSHHQPQLHYAYDLVDLFAYPALGAGPYDYHVLAALSDIFQGTHPAKFDNYSGQIRLVMNSSSTVNPYSPLTVRRYDLIDSAVVNNYESALRAKIRKLDRDPEKVANYKSKIKASWYVND